MKTAREIIKEKAKQKNVLLIRFLSISDICDAMEDYANQFKYDYSKNCNCGNERIGETWCCNQCGLPVSK
jgi:hypothetical protein